MRLARRDGAMWHFADPDHCGWAQTFTERDSFDEYVDVSSVDRIGEFCSMCRDRRGL